MNQEEVNALLRKKQQIRNERDTAFQAVLKKHFMKMDFIQSSGVNIAAQTTAIVNSIRKVGLAMCAEKVDAMADTVAYASRYSDDDDDDDDKYNSEEVYDPRDKDSLENNDNIQSNGLDSIRNIEKKSPSIAPIEQIDVNCSQTSEALMSKNTSQTTTSSQAAEDSFFSEDIRQLLTAMDNQLEEYCKVLLIPSNNSVKFKESLKECNHAPDQLAQQIKIIEDRSLENSKQYFDSLCDDDHKGGNARLVRSIAINVQSVEDSTRKLQADITASRKEFLKMSQLNGLLEVAPHHSYEKVRNTFAHIRRLSQKKSDESNKQWLQFEKKCRETQFAEMRRIYAMYVGSSDPAVIQAANEEGIQSFESKLQEHRVCANQKLKEFNNKIIDISDRNIDKITSDADVLLSWRHKIIPWELREQADMEASLASSINEVEEKYSSVVEDLRDHYTQVLAQIDALEFHRQKLSHLRRIPARKQRSMRDRSGTFPSKPTSKTRVGGGHPPGNNSSSRSSSSKKTPHTLMMEDIPTPENSLRLGTRTVQLGRLVSIDDEECLSLLSQMLHDVIPDTIVMKRLQHYISHYTKLSNMQTNASKT